MSSKQKKKKGGGKPVKKAGGPGGFPVLPVIVTLLVIVAGVGAGLLIWSQTRGSGDGGGGLKLETGIKLPSFINQPDAPPNTRKAYQIALTIPDDLAQVPCYCGCSADGHTSNLDCFIKERSGNNVIFDDHATY